MPIRPYRTGAGKKRYQADVANTRRGLPRIKRSFTTRKEAEDWVHAIKQQAHGRFVGEREHHTFGEALTRYLLEESPRKQSGRDDIGNATALRYPVWDGYRWVRLEHVPLEEMVPALATWTAEQRRVTRRRYIGKEYYTQRADEAGTQAWFHQPSPAEDDTPRPRVAVTDRTLLARLDQTGGRGPYATDTLRIRQVLARRILRLAWRRWNWLETDIGAHIDLEKASAGRELYLSEQELDHLVAAAAAAKLPDGAPDPVGPHFSDLIAGAAVIGWRRRNILELDWSRVVFPVYEDVDGERQLVQVGMIWVRGSDTKNDDMHAYPIGDELLTLLQRRWDLRLAYTDKRHDQSFNLVFHDGTGRPFGDTRKRFATAKRLAGVPADFRWHDLRHTWASHLAQRGVSDRHLQELGNWKDQTMVRRYSKLRVQHLLDAVNR